MNKLISMIYICAENTEFNEGHLPVLQVVNIIAPIVLTIITIFLTIVTNNNNSKLQKQISNRDIINQTRNIILNIYDTYNNLLNELSNLNGNVVFAFSSENNYLQLKDILTKHLISIQNSFKHLKLLVPNDKELIDYLASCNKDFENLYNAVSNYINTQEPKQVIDFALNKIQTEHGLSWVRDTFGNISNIVYNTAIIRENYLKQCSTSSTDNIQKCLNICINQLLNEDFNEKFKKYIQINELKI